MILHLQIAGVLLLTLGLGHALFDRYFGWNRELAAVSLLTRRVFQVHSSFIGLLLVLLGAGTLLHPTALLQPSPLSRGLLAAIVLFWACRLYVQLFVYDAAIWRGNRFYTLMHVVFTLLWMYLVAIYGAAMRIVWSTI